MVTQPSSACRSFIFIAATWLPFAGRAQTLAWAHDLGGPGLDQCSSVAVDRDGNSIWTGRFTEVVDVSFGGPGDLAGRMNEESMLLAKLRPNGTRLWAFTIPGAHGRDLAMDTDGNIHVLGSCSGRIDLDPSVTDRPPVSATEELTGFAASYSPDGALRWAHFMDTEGHVHGCSIAVSATGLTYASLTVNAGGPDHEELVCLDDAGNEIWHLVFDPVVEGAVVWDITADPAGGVFMAGLTDATVDMDPLNAPDVRLPAASPWTAFLARYTERGACRDIVALPPVCFVNGMSCLGSDVYIAGSLTGEADMDPGEGVRMLTPNSSSLTSFLARYSPALGIRDAFLFDGEPGASLTVMDMAVHPGGTIALTGRCNGTVDLDPDPERELLSTTPRPEGLFVATYNASGRPQWSVTAHGSGYVLGWHLAMGSTGSVFVSGINWGAVDFDPSADRELILSSRGEQDIIMARYDPIWPPKPEIGGKPETGFHWPVDMHAPDYLLLLGGAGLIGWLLVRRRKRRRQRRAPRERP